MLDQMGNAFGNFHILENLSLSLGGRLGSARPHELPATKYATDDACELERATDDSEKIHSGAFSLMNIDTAAATAASALLITCHSSALIPKMTARPARPAQVDGSAARS